VVDINVITVDMPLHEVQVKVVHLQRREKMNRKANWKNYRQKKLFYDPDVRKVWEQRWVDNENFIFIYTNMPSYGKDRLTIPKDLRQRVI